MPAKTRRYRDLNELLDVEEARAKEGLASNARYLIEDASSALDPQRLKRHPVGAVVASAAALWLLFGRRRGGKGGRRAAVLVPLLMRFASSTALGALLGRAARTKSSRYFPF